MHAIRTLILAVLTAAVIPCAAPAQAPPPPGEGEQQPPPVRRVKVTAEGYSKEDSVKQALRRALEEGAGAQIASFSTVENFTLISDTIYSRASGIVTDYQIVRQEEGPGGSWETTIEASVRPDAVAQAWGEVQNVLDQIGRPKIMVWIDEKIDGELQDDSIVQARIEEMFLKAGFDLVDRKGLADLKAREAGDANDERNMAKLARLAKDEGAHLFIRGSASADSVGLRNIHGVRAAFYNCGVQARIYYTDTAKLLVSESIPNRERGVRAHHELNKAAARAALVAATFADPGSRRQETLALKLFQSVMEQWSTLISFARDIELEVQQLDFRGYTALRRALTELPGIRSVDGDFTKETGVYRVKAQISAQTLSERFLEAPFNEWLEVIDLKPNRIQARALRPPQ